MTEITRNTEFNSDIIISLVTAPFATLLVTLGFYIAAITVAAVVELFVDVPKYLSDIVEFFGAASFVTVFAIPFGFVQFVLIGGWVLRRYLAAHTPNPVVIAVLALAANSMAFGLLYGLSTLATLDGFSVFMKLFLFMGAIFAPVWGCVAGLLIRHRQTQRNQSHV
ncbi:hypothetical protein TRL7639_03685 [Falsiruegeria litorea R37]|uniref:Uncharacterized protein n=1 Tax=Falsiruegeria litorea R37 TaxID=1200284 RepID=A0A1Y5TPN1_9RHOB|nr:hypothetical protein [Falsiruegeria litorea]SLN65363.1 hypothetical protein TRL7639_03685 [Falsiruegeria litorea R37]